MGLCKVITKANLVIYGALLLKKFLFPHNPPSTAERTNNSHDKECRWWHKISAHQPGQRAGRRAETSAQEVQRCRGRAGAGTVHTSPAKQSTGLGSQSKWAQAPRHKGWAQEAEASAHEPHSKEGGLRGPKEAHTSRSNAEESTQAPTKQVSANSAGQDGQWSQGQVGSGVIADMLRGPLWSSCGNRRD